MRDERSASLVALASSRARCRARWRSSARWARSRSRCLFKASWRACSSGVLLSRTSRKPASRADASRNKYLSSGTASGSKADAPRFAGRPLPRV